MDPTQKTPSGLHVPVELLEQIVTSDGHRLSLHSICNLRLVCRSFADGLLPLLGGSKELDVYLDDEGMNELGKIATSPFAPYIRKLSISIRRVAHFPIAFQQTHRAFATSREDLIDAYKQRADDFTNQINDLDFSRASSWHELRDHAALAGFDSVPGPVGCKLVPNCEDFTPDDEVIREFAMLLRLFPVIETIRSCEEVKHGMIVVLDANGSRLTRRLVKLQRASLTQPRVSAHCVCDRNYDSDVSASFRSPRRVCRNVRSMSRHLVWDVPRIAKYVLPKAALFQTLKKIRLTFVNTTLGQQRTTADEMQGVAQFLLSCKNVASLELLARKNNAGNRTNSSITGVIEHLAAWKWTAKLRSLKLSSVNPVNAHMVGFLAQQPALRLVHFENCAEDSVSNSTKQLIELWKVLKNLPHVSLCLHDFQKAPRSPVQRVSLTDKMDSAMLDASKVPKFLDEMLAQLNLTSRP